MGRGRRQTSHKAYRRTSIDIGANLLQNQEMSHLDSSTEGVHIQLGGELKLEDFDSVGRRGHPGAQMLNCNTVQILSPVSGFKTLTSLYEDGVNFAAP